MLSIAKLRVGQEAYTLAGVAQSLDDYYTGAGEADGQWLGAGAERLGLSDRVDANDLRAVLAGLAPGSGGLTPDGTTVRTHARRVPGFDVTFKTPKSVSALYAVSDDPRVQAAIIAAGENAVRATVSWLEREAIRVRRGSGDAAYLNDLAARDPDAAHAARLRVLPGRGVVAASFRHRTSRAGDPLLHWHTLVANLVEGPDGRWGAFVHPELYRAARAAGEVFQSILRGELTDRLGVEWRPGRHVLEIAGVPQALCDRFSKRAAEIDAWLTATGTPADPVGRQAAVLATRKGKPEREGERLDVAWKSEAIAAGWGPEHAEAFVASMANPDPTARVDDAPHGPAVDALSADDAIDPDRWVRELGRLLTEHDSTFTRPALLQAVAARFTAGATIDTIERAAARALASAHIVPIADDRTERWTTTELLAVEHRFLHSAETTRTTRRPIPASIVDDVLATGTTLGADQAAAVRALTATTDGLAVLVGPAGTGKTYTLDAVRRVFEAAGRDVIGVAPSARAAHELANDAHIPSSTIHRQLGAWTRGYDVPTERTVLVVDEAGMAGIRDLERVVTPVLAAGGRVLLSGDHHQLPEISAGGGFAALATDPTVTVAQLTINRRQHEPWERVALTELRDGHVARAVAAYRDHQRVIVTAERTEMVATGVDRWFAAHHGGLVPVLIAGTNELVDALNHTIRHQLLDRGILQATPSGDDTSLAIGERLVVAVNDYEARTLTGATTAVLNGHTGTLTDLSADGLVVRMDHDGTAVHFATNALASGRLAYAYASTAHKAQGGTWDLAITVGLGGLYREAGYVAMSRGRASNWLIVTQSESDTVDADLARHDSTIPLTDETSDAIGDVLGRLHTTRRKLLARARGPHVDEIQHAATTLDLSTLELRADHARTVEATATQRSGGNAQHHRDRLARTEHTAHHAALGQQIKAWDRRNIGIITGINDTTGTVDVTFTATDGRTSTRTMAWSDVSIVTPHPAPRPLTAPAEHSRTRATAATRTDLAAWEQHLAAHDVRAGDAHIYTSAVQLAVDRAAAALTAEQPEWLTNLIGRRPTDRPATTQVWDDAVRQLAAHRLRHGILEPTIATGPDATNPAHRHVWAATTQTLAQARRWLDTHRTGPELPVTRTRSREELAERQRNLETIFATAPADVRGLIDRLRDPARPTLEDTTELLGYALDARGERQQWILCHWPHVVEAAQIRHALDHGIVGPDLGPLLDTLAESSHPHLAAAAVDRQPWIRTLVSHLVATDATTIDATTEHLLADVAAYRQRWTITSPEPFGDGAVDLDQANERTRLTTAINTATGAYDLDHTPARPNIVDPMTLLDDILS